MSDEEEVKKPGIMLNCGHEASFEHALVEGVLLMLMVARQRGSDGIEPAMEFVRRVCERYCVRLPSWEEVQAINMATMTEQDKGVH